MMKSSLVIMFVLFSIVLMAHMGQMKLVEASSNRMLSQAADQNGFCFIAQPNVHTIKPIPLAASVIQPKVPARGCKSTSEGPLIASSKHSLFAAAAPDSIVFPCPSQFPHNQTHPVCCECDPTKGSCKTCCKISLN